MTVTNDDRSLRSDRMGRRNVMPNVPVMVAGARGSGRYVGRVGALAVALGIGIAVANSTGVAWADDTSGASSSTTDSSTAGDSSGGEDDSPSATSLNTGPRATTSTTTRELTSQRDDQSAADPEGTDTAESTDGADPEDADSSTETPEDVAAEDVTTPEAPPETPITDDTGSVVETRTQRDSAGEYTASPSPTDAPAATPEPESVETAEPASSSVVAESDDTTSTLPSTQQVVAVNTGPVDTAGGDELDTATTQNILVAPTVVAQVTPITAFFTGVVNWISGISQAANSPVPPPQSPTLWAILSWLRREVEYSLFNQGPRINYNPTQNVQTHNGVVVGDINPTDADNDKLTLTVTGNPTSGTVVVNQDGTFVYTPTAAMALNGGTATFQVTVDDRPGNPPHFNLLALFKPNNGATTTKTITVTVNPTSPLGTADQIAAEARAQTLLETPEVKAALAAFKDKLLLATATRFSGGPPDAENMALLDQAVREFGMAAALQAQAVDPTNPKVIEYLLPPHNWYGQSVEGSRVVFDNPDTLYRIISVNSASSYVIHGQFVGGVPVDVNFSVGAPGGATVALINLKDLVVAPDGTFTIYANTDTTNLPPNHLLLTPTANQILIRDTFSDWSTQTPMSLSVERVAGPAANPPPTDADLIVRIQAALNQGGNAFGFFLNQATVMPNPVPGGQPATVPKPANFFLPIATGGSQTLATQFQSVGNFQLADDQAIVITVNPGRAGYFVVPVTNDWAITGDYWNQQTSLNNGQATANSDGSYTIVISPTDPGVENWVSTGGLNQGTIFLRFQALGEATTVTDPETGQPVVTNNPSFSTEVMTLDELHAVMPPTFTAEQREAQLAKRKAGYDARYAPFTQL